MKAVNLLPSDMRGAGKPASAIVAGSDEATGRVGAFALLGVLAFCVVALAAYVLASNTVKDRKAELATAKAQAESVTRQADALKPYADFAAQAQERVQTVRDLAASRFDWEQAFRDIARVVPRAVTLSSLDASISSASGSSGSGLRSAIAAPAIDLTGCTSGGQRDVATLMSRLGNIDGVTRVSLSKSEKPDLTPPGTSVGAATGTIATGTTGATGGCKGRATTFDLVVFFERSKVPATTDDVSVAGSGSTATSTTATSASSTTTAAPAATPAATPAVPPTTSTAP
jgi:Tfp pilus assembly protein PilN